MVDVFISYSRADEDAVRRLAHKIESEGYDVWWDAELPPHKSYGEVIEEKVGSAKAAVVVWSRTAAASEWVRAEADMARNQKKLIQTALGDIMPPMPFNQIQFADIGDWQGEDDHSGWRKVKASLSDLCGSGDPEVAAAAAAAPPPPPPPAAPQPVYEPAQASASKWPLFAGIGIALLAIVGSVAFFMGASSGDETGGESTSGETPIAAETAPAPAPTAPPEAPASASRGRVVGCYFWNSVYEYDGACRFVAGSEGDFTTFALDGPYFEGVVRIDLDIASPGVGTIEMHYPDGSVVPVAVRRSDNDRACWDGPSLTFCAR